MELALTLLSLMERIRPNAHPYLSDPEIVLLNVIPDALIALAFLSLPVALLIMMRRRGEYALNPLFVLFGSVLFLCGAVHIVEIFNVWHDDYLVLGIVKSLAAVASVITAFVLWPTVQRFLALPSPNDLIEQLRSHQNRHRELQIKVERRTRELDHANRELRRLASIVNSSHDAIIGINRSGDISEWNHGAEMMLGFSHGEVVGRSFTTFIPKHKHAEFEQVLATSYSNGGMRSFESDFEREDSTIATVSFSVSPISDTSGGYANQSVALIGRDITEQKRFEERFRIAFEAAPNGMYLLNSQGRVVLCNHIGEKMLGFAHRELIGRSLSDLLTTSVGEAGALIGLDYLLYNPAQESQRRELTLRRADGEIIAVHMGLTPVESREGHMAICSIVDMTEQRRYQDQLHRSLQEKEVLLREIHHRVKNSMQVISSLLKLQSASLADPVAKEMLRESEERVRSMALVHEKLYRSSGLDKVDFQSYLKQLALDLHRVYITPDKKVRLDIDSEPVEIGIDKAVPCGLIMNEMISNALKHAFVARREGVVHIGLHQGRGSIQLRIADDGCGIPESIDMAAPKTLGLRVIKTLCQQLKCTLKVNRDRGTEFILNIPNTVHDEINIRGPYGRGENEDSSVRG